jgi:hypothetical protein
MKKLAVILSAVITLLTVPAWAQTDDGTARLREKLRQGDRVKLTLDSGMVAGRVESVGVNQLTVWTDEGEQLVPFTSITEARRTRRGMLLGTLIGAGVGAAFGAVAASYAENETGSASAAFLTVMAMGIGAGAGIDALVNLERTVYRRPSSSRVSIAPAVGAGRGGLAATVRW